jgi:peptidoglycan/xylan/chitin deacetylase (PgdA/CDA1 family)
VISPTENPRYGYSAIESRPIVTWPNQASVALLVVVNVEHFRFDRPSSDLTWNGPTPDVDSFSQRDYGVRIGFWRLLRILAKHGVRVTAALNSDVCNFYPDILAAGRAHGWEWIGHGRSNSQLLAGLAEEEERQLIVDSLSTIERSTGHRPRGWLSPRVVETLHTPDLLAEAGVDYLLDWSADELPFPMRVRTGRMLCLPYTRELNDLPAMIRKNHTAREFHDMICDQFDVLLEEGGRVLTISLHPFVSGHPFRAKWLDQALTYIMERPGVWSATGSELADWYEVQGTGLNPATG